ncbi:MAG: cytochrome C [Candidatus Entotheonella factor]|uniref:Cytochrome C n=2 Tax=Candidatus Entotheonella TaxID=93171 RepID=W4LID0_ENTF1|nr:MAG: cytochrome C [Candidatus Entotheonella factor]
MCFRNLPIEFDEHGQARLKEGVNNPYDYQVIDLSEREDKVQELLAKNGFVKNVDYDPVTRVAGALAFHSVVDMQERKVLSTNSMATLFRGYEVILRGRDPRDAAYISSRACGVCGGVHATTAALALEMALGIEPPPLGIAVRNLLLSIEYLYDHPLHLFLLAGPDYSEQLINATNPELYQAAKQAPANHRAQHGYATVGDIMDALNPLTGQLYLEALAMTRVAREAYVLIGGKYPHPQSVVPGGVAATINTTVLNEMYTRLQRFFDYSQKVVGIWDDVFDFMLAFNPAYNQCGVRPATMADTGVWDRPGVYDGTYANMDAWGKARWATPGVLVDGEVVTTDLSKLNAGMEEFIEHSYYDKWDGQRFPEDPLGLPLSPNHPWNKETKPRPGKQSWRDRYSWDTSPTWDRMPMEAGAYTRLYMTAKARELPPSNFLEATGYSLKMKIPGGTLPDAELEWKVPEHWNAFERNRARAYAIAYSAMVSMENWMMAQEMIRQGETDVSVPFEIPKTGTHLGVGFWGAGRGFLSHHLIIDDGAIGNYQIITPSTLNAAPRTPWGEPGPYEEAVLNTPILENTDTDNFMGIDILRAIRSFDPCMPCTTHIMVDGADKMITREVTTCACGVE